MARLSHRSAFFMLLAVALTAGCDVPSGDLQASMDRGAEDGAPFVSFGLDRELTPAGELNEPSGFVVGPETVAVFVGEELVVELELVEPDMFSLIAGGMPDDAEFTEMPSGGIVFWRPEIDDVGTHEFSLLVVDADEPNLVIAQEMLVVDVIPRHRFIEYGF